MSRLPRTGIHHTFEAAWFALCCLAYAITHPPRKAR